MNNIITISGDPGSGKSTTINGLKQCFEERGKKVYVYSVGRVFRDLADKRNMSVMEFNKFLQQSSEDVDAIIDKAVENYGKRVLEDNSQDKIYIVDSRLAWHSIPSSFKVRLTIDEEIAGKRVFNDKSRGKEDTYQTLEDAIAATRKRKQSEAERYKTIYGEDVDISNCANFDINIDTSYLSTEQIVGMIYRAFEEKNRERKQAGTQGEDGNR